MGIFLRLYLWLFFKVESELSDLEGVLEAKVDLAAKSGTFKYDSKVTPDVIVKTINDLGFKAKLVWHLIFLTNL